MANPNPETVMMVSETSICNQALSWLGQTPIASLDDQSTVAVLCKQNYHLLRDAVLSERVWTFATVRAVSETERRDEWDQMYTHPIPPVWLDVFRVGKDVRTNGDLTDDPTWRKEGGKILSNYPKIYLWGVERVADTGRMSLMFTQALAARIAADLCIAITENDRLQADLWALYIDKLSAAAARDGQQGNNDRITQTRLTGVRRAGGTGMFDVDG